MFSVHYQESSAVYTDIGMCHTGYGDCLLAGSGWNSILIPASLSLTTAIDGVGSQHTPAALPPVKIPDTNCTGGRVGSRGGLNGSGIKWIALSATCS